MTAVLALDQGTTGSTALVLSDAGRVLGRGYREFTQHFPSPGEVEHDAEEILRVTVEAAREAIRQAKVTPQAIGITNQRETICAWERESGRPVHRAIVWQDRRTAARCAQLEKQKKSALVRSRTGLVIDPYFSATKVEWLLEHVKGLRKRAKDGDVVFGTIDSWLIFRLTNGKTFATDHTNASRTMLYDIGRRVWDRDLLKLFGVPRDALPDVRKSSGNFGTAAAEHFGTELPISGVAGDQQAALFGQGCWKPGQAKNTYGTGAFLLLNTGKRRANSKRGLLTTLACGPRGEPAYALEGSVFIAGAAIQWLRDGLGLLARAGDSEALAASVPDSGGVVMVPAFVGLGAPYWRPDVRGALLGLTRGTTRAHVVRAALESLAFQTRDLIEAMARSGKKAGGAARNRGAGGAPSLRVRALKVDGGASANDF